MPRKSFSRSLMDRLCSRFGFEIVPAWRVDRHELAEHLRNVFRQAAVETVIDVGANRGQYHDFLRLEVGYDGPIHSFEPVGGLAELLKKRAAADPHWHIHHCALGRVDGVVTLNVMRDDQFSSVLPPKSTGLNDYDVKNSIVEVQSVASKRLDEVIASMPELASCRRIYLKLDTQGFDLEVFAGASGALDQVVAMQSEVSMQQLYEGMPDYKASIAVYDESGFEISGLFPISRDQYLRVVEFDCVAVRHQRMTPGNPAQR